MTEPGLNVSRNKERKLDQQPLTKKADFDHPLNSKASSEWDAYFKDTAILEQIDIDIRRTLADVGFFQREVPLSPAGCTSSQSSPLYSPGIDATACSSSSDLTAPWGSISGQDRRSLFRRLEHKNERSFRTSRPIKMERSLSLTHVAGIGAGIGAGIVAGTPQGDAQLPLPGSTVDPQRRHSQVSLHPIKITKALSDLQQIPECDIDLDIESLSDESDVVEETPAQTNCQLEPASEVQDFHWEAMERILFVYVKLNPGVGYVQGMNELLGPLYYICANDVENSWIAGKPHAEADAFYLFTLLMGFVRDHYVKDFDQDKVSGIHAALEQLHARLQFSFPQIVADLNAKRIELTFYAFRWITVLGTHEFPLPDVIRLWDGLFSYCPNGVLDPVNAMVMVSVAMHWNIHDRLLAGSFSDNLHLLQHLPTVDVAQLLTLAFSFNNDFVNGNHTFIPGSKLSNNTLDQTSSFKNLVSSEKPQPQPQPHSSQVIPNLGSRDLPTLSSVNFASRFNKAKESLVSSGGNTLEITIPPVYKEKIFQSWAAAKRFLNNTHK